MELTNGSVIIVIVKRETRFGSCTAVIDDESILYILAGAHSLCQDQRHKRIM